jgi:hypothetical protein
LFGQSHPRPSGEADPEHGAAAGPAEDDPIGLLGRMDSAPPRPN